MAVLARGSVTDRPWGLTFGALGVRGLTGELAVVVDGKAYRVAFNQGIIFGATSPLASDAAVRVAMTSNLITSTQVADITRRMAAAPDRDEVDLLAELARLGPDQAARLRRRLVANRAARAFSLDRGDFVVEDSFTIGYLPGNELDVRSVAYLGAKNNFNEDRMGTELGALGGWFQLKQEAVEDLPQFGFTETEKPILQNLLEGADLVDMEQAHQSLGARAVRAVTYALVSCGACEIRPSNRATRSAAPRPPGQSAPATRPAGQPAPAARPQQAARPAAPASTPGSGPVRAPAAPGSSPGSGGVRAPVSATATAASNQASGAYRMPTPAPAQPSSPPDHAPRTPMSTAEQRPVRSPVASQPRRAKRNTAAIEEIDQLLASKVPLLDSGADHFALLGLTSTASPDEIQKAYFMLARKLHPDRLSAIGVVDEARHAQRLMAEINAAFAILNDSAKRAEYISILQRGGARAIKAQEAQADEMAMRIMRAEEVFRQGEMAMRRDQVGPALQAFQQAVELQPNEPEYQALLAWAQFAAAPDKNAVANNARKALQRAMELNDRSPTARFYLGRVERMVGREREALQHFQEVLRIKPNHAEAASEVRLLEQRLKGKR